MDYRGDSTFFLVVVILITGGLFAPILGFGFNLATDDVFFVLQNPSVKDTSFKGLLTVAASPGHVYGEIQPIPYVSLWMDHAVFGMRAWGYYSVQILIHLINVVLVFLLIKSVSGSEFIALVTALIFAIHPLQVDAVAMVNQRKTLLAAMFSLRKRSPGAPRLGMDFDERWLFSFCYSREIAPVFPSLLTTIQN